MKEVRCNGWTESIQNLNVGGLYPTQSNFDHGPRGQMFFISLVPISHFAFEGGEGTLPRVAGQIKKFMWRDFV